MQLSGNIWLWFEAEKENLLKVAMCLDKKLLIIKKERTDSNGLCSFQYNIHIAIAISVPTK